MSLVTSGVIVSNIIGASTGSALSRIGSSITGGDGATPELSWPIESPILPVKIKQTIKILFMVSVESSNDFRLVTNAAIQT
jgi:hypothetical protein